MLIISFTILEKKHLDMLSREQHLLVCLSEECAEVQKEISKILRFGMSDKHISSLAGNTLEPNSARLSQEIVDVQALIRMLIKEGTPIEIRQRAIITKCKQVETYMKYAQEKGMLE